MNINECLRNKRKFVEKLGDLRSKQPLSQPLTMINFKTRYY